MQEILQNFTGKFHEDLNKLFENLYVRKDAAAEDLANIIDRLEEIVK